MRTIILKRNGGWPHLCSQQKPERGFTKMLVRGTLGSSLRCRSTPSRQPTLCRARPYASAVATAPSLRRRPTDPLL